MKKDIKILIVDDSEFMRVFLKDVLSMIGFSKFIECVNGEECLKKYFEEKPDLILLDIVMPVLDGMEVLKKIGREAKIVAISAMGQEKIIEEAKQYGARGYIVKPFVKAKIEEELEKVLS